MSGIKRIPTPYSYSSEVVAGDYVFLGLHRGFGESFVVQLESAFKHISETLGKLGMRLEDLVKVNVWLKDIRDLLQMEKLFNEHFAKDQFPARMTATTEFIDVDCLLMMEGIAYLKH